VICRLPAWATTRRMSRADTGLATTPSSGGDEEPVMSLKGKDRASGPSAAAVPGGPGRACGLPRGTVAVTLRQVSHPYVTPLHPISFSSSFAMSWPGSRCRAR
jgi:hypothetical protein